MNNTTLQKTIFLLFLAFNYVSHAQCNVEEWTGTFRKTASTSFGQSFKSPCNSSFKKFRFYFTVIGQSSIKAKATIKRGNNGKHDNSDVIATINNISLKTGWNDFDFSSKNIELDAGATYTVILYKDDSHNYLESREEYWYPYRDGKLWIDGEKASGNSTLIFVVEANDFPTSNDMELYTQINEPYIFNSNDFEFNDSDALQYVKIKTIDNTAIYLDVNGDTILEASELITPDTEIAKTAIDEGKLQLFSATLGQGNFTFAVSDGKNYSREDYTAQVYNVNATLPTITNNEPTEITNTGATISGEITDTGGAGIVEKGIVWSTSPNPSINDSKIVFEGTEMTFSEDVYSFSQETTIYYKTYAENISGIAYGEEKQFITKKIALEATVQHATNGNNGEITFEIKNSNNTPFHISSSFFNHGTYSSNKSLTYTGRSPGEYTLNIADSKGKRVSLTVSIKGQASVQTYATEEVSYFTAKAKGKITDNGNDEITEYGFVFMPYNYRDYLITKETPGVLTSVVATDNHLGDFESTIERLSVNTRYIIRAYAQNSQGIVYGGINEFTTLVETPELSVDDIEKTYGDDDFTINVTTNSSGSLYYYLIDENNGFHSELNGTRVDANGNITVGNAGQMRLYIGVAASGIYRSLGFYADLTIHKKELNVYADNVTKYYGDAIPALTTTIIGFENNDEITDLQNIPSLSTTATKHSPPGVYPITVTDEGVDTNYNYVLHGGNLEVVKRPLTITIGNYTKIYGDANPTLEYITSGFADGEDETVLDTPIEITCDADSTSSVGSFPITIATVTDNHYEFNFQHGTLSVLPRALEITPNATAKPYTASDPVILYRITQGQLVNDDVILFEFERAPGEGVGIYPISNSNTPTNPNYTYSFVSNNFHILPLPIEVGAMVIQNIHTNTITVASNITNDPGEITEYGFVWAETPIPTLVNNSISVPVLHISFNADITNLSPTTTYYVRAYAKNGSGIYYGEETLVSTATLHNEEIVLKELKIYPTYAKKVVYIKAKTKPTTVVLYNLTGKKVLEEKPVNPDFKIEVGHLKSGIYVLELQFNTAKKTVKIIKS